jgi:hypothetical protein
MSSIHQHRQLYLIRAADIHKGVQSGPNGTPRVEHIIHQHDTLPLKIPGYVGPPYERLGVAKGEIIPIEGNIQLSHGGAHSFELLQQIRYTLRQRYPPAMNPHEDDILDTLVPLRNLVSHTLESPLHILLVQHLGLVFPHHLRRLLHASALIKAEESIKKRALLPEGRTEPVSI